MATDVSPQMPTDWAGVKMAIFDVDGTLYRQRPVRIAMALALVANGLRRLSTREAKILASYRHGREQDINTDEGHFDDLLISRVAAEAGSSEQAVRAIVQDWLHRRPLRHLHKAARTGIADLFGLLCARGIAIGILSDYPAEAKIGAMGLAADYIVHAEERDVARLKPHGAGLHKLLRLAGTSPRQTVYIGDRADRDGILGVREGVPTILIGGDALAGCRSIASFTELNEELRHLHHA